MSVVVAPDEVSLNTSCENVRLPSSAAHERHAPGPWPRLRLDTDYAASLATIPNGSRKRAGIRIGAAVTAAMLAKRANDGRFGTFTFTAGTAAGDWRPELPAMLSDAFAWVANVKPFAIRRASQFRTAGPLSLTSAKYAAEVNEVKALGALNGRTRTAAPGSTSGSTSGHQMCRAPSSDAESRRTWRTTSSSGTTAEPSDSPQRHGRRGSGARPYSFGSQPSPSSSASSM